MKPMNAGNRDARPAEHLSANTSLRRSSADHHSESRLLKVLVVDDELPIRQELRAFPWQAHDAVLVGEADNGAQALELIGSLQPDVVVTDITMPVMDGIALLKALRRSHPHIQVVLLTCHSDFHYAQEAIRLGALAYMLKVSVEDEELAEALRKSRAALAKELSYEGRERSERRTRHARQLFRLLEGGGAPQLDPPGVPPYRLARVLVNDACCEHHAVQEEIKAALDVLEAQTPSWLTWIALRGREYLVLFEDAAAPDRMLRALHETSARLDALLAPHRPAAADPAVCAVAGESFAELGQLQQALRDTSLWKEAFFYDYQPQRRVYAGRPIPLAELDEAARTELDTLLRRSGRDAQTLTACWTGELRTWCLKRRPAPQPLKQRLLHWLLAWMSRQGRDRDEYADSGFNRVPGLSDPPTQGAPDAVPALDALALSEASTLEALVQTLTRLTARPAAQAERLRIEVREAQRWMREHLRQPLSLAVVAGQVGLSPHYLSRLFKEETGESVNQYVTRLRMERAIELLTTTSMKVYEIAEAVGIPSYRYFTVTFRNWTGMAPTEYKR
ncbi:response regulator [Paenibacillus sp. IB182496]|uniref:Response regulator n=1 Tax=Paenibacillus sabuli TaxID=2772509 RepID=A0A927GRZ7_9BACL|nr:response regulator [Paenibacillus sabuli]MBD2845776.1 response regulator [Paenibacillus sabuli]